MATKQKVNEISRIYTENIQFYFSRCFVMFVSVDFFFSLLSETALKQIHIYLIDFW